MEACTAVALRAPCSNLASAHLTTSSSTKAVVVPRAVALKQLSLRGSPLPTHSSSHRVIHAPLSSRGHRSSVRAGLFDFLSVFVKPKVSDEDRAALKEELLQAIEPVQRGATATEEDKEIIEELAARLEAVNPNPKALASPLLNGKWKLLYTTSGSILGLNKPFLFRPQGPIFQSLDSETLQARNMETWPLFNQVQASLTPTSASSVDVKFDEFKILGMFPIKAPDSARGYLDITYLDEDLRVSRGNLGNLFVLCMEDASFRIRLPGAEGNESEAEE